MEYSYRKRFKTYEDSELTEGIELVNIYYSNSSAKSDDAIFVVTPVTIERTTAKTVYFKDAAILRQGQIAKDKIGLVYGTDLFVRKEEVDEAIQFMRDGYITKQQDRVDKLLRELADLRNAEIKYVEEKGAI